MRYLVPLLKFTGLTLTLRTRVDDRERRERDVEKNIFKNTM